MNKQLSDLVNELTENANVESVLQKIMKVLIQEYEIVINGNTIIPLWLEAYYYSSFYKDKNVHGAQDEYSRKMQTNRPGQLYIHKNDWGVDICLSSGEYCLSFLIKCGLVNGVFCSQNAIGQNMCYCLCKNNSTCKRINECGYNNNDEGFKDVLKRSDKKRNIKVMKTVRVNTTKDDKYNNRLLAAFVFEKQYLHLYSWSKGYSKQWSISINSLLENGNRRTADTDNGSRIEDVYWESAERYYQSYLEETS